MDDDVLENEEMFLLSFESDDQSIVFAEAAVTITDDDCKTISCDYQYTVSIKTCIHV